MRIASALVALFLTAPVSASAAEQFDLICKGEQTVGVRGTPTPFTKRYRLDLATKRWCAGDCPVAGPISEVSADAIVLTDPKRDEPREPSNTHWINRVTGELHDTSHNPRTASLRDAHGTCVVAPFSGFPAAKF